MHRALKACFLIALVLGYALPHAALSRTICLVTLEECDCGVSASDCCTLSHGEEGSDAPLAPEPPCCLSLSASPDWFVAESVRPLSGVFLIGPISYGEDDLSPPVYEVAARVPLSAPPPGLSGRMLFLQCERLLI